jgi:hypothetical protein
MGTRADLACLLRGIHGQPGVPLLADRIVFDLGSNLCSLSSAMHAFLTTIGVCPPTFAKV